MAHTAHSAFEHWLRDRFQHRLATAQILPEPSSLEVLLQAAATNASRSDFFLQSATLPEVADFGVLAYALGSASSLNQAIEIALSHALFNNQNVRLVTSATNIPGNGDELPRLTLQLELVRAMSEPANCAITEECLSTLVGLLNWRQSLLAAAPLTIEHLALGNHRRSPRADSGAMHNGGNAEDYRKHLGVEPAGEARRTELRLRASNSTDTLARNHPAVLTAVLGSYTSELHRTKGGHQGLAAQLLNTLIESFGKVGRADLAAKALRTSERTMRRRLAQEQTSFQKVLDQYRAALARDYLSSTTLTTQQIGELLGFTEATNFRRAFLRWVKQSPHHYRAQVRSERDAAEQHSAAQAG
ncbi:MAG: helix-turn-helix transcriptional regulator [Pseudomonadales bacterium]